MSDDKTFNWAGALKAVAVVVGMVAAAFAGQQTAPAPEPEQRPPLSAEVEHAVTTQVEAAVRHELAGIAADISKVSSEVVEARAELAQVARDVSAVTSGVNAMVATFVDQQARANVERAETRRRVDALERQ